MTIERGETLHIGAREYVVTEIDYLKERVTLVQVNGHSDDQIRVNLSMKKAEELVEGK